MIEIGQRWRRIGPGFDTGDDPQIFIIEVLEITELSGPFGSVRMKAVQDSNRTGQIRSCGGLPTDTDSNQYWALLEGQEAPCP